MAHFQLITTDGEALGPVELPRPDCPPGSVIYRPPGEPNLRVVDYIPAETVEKFSILVVERRKEVVRPEAAAGFEQAED